MMMKSNLISGIGNINHNNSNNVKKYDHDNNDISICSIRKSVNLNNLKQSSPVKMKSPTARILPPLPLQEFQIDPNDYPIPITINGEKIKYINHNINDNNKDDDFYEECECTVEGNLHDPFVSKRLSKYFTYSDRMETKILGLYLKKYVLYICPSFSFVFNDSNNDNNDNNDRIKSVDRICLSKLPCLTFDSEFESGNIDVVQLVEGRDMTLLEKGLEKVSKDKDFQLPEEVNQEYDITIRNDINTAGNIQWYYFSINSGNYSSNTDLSTDLNNVSGKQWSYPCSIRFNIINFSKSDSLYNYGMRPVVFSQKRYADTGKSWSHDDTSDICYYLNRMESNDNKGPDLVYFAHCYPYTYSDHLQYIKLLEEDKRISKLMRRSLLCSTILGNRCDLLTITNRGSSVEELKARSAIVITARIHPGEIIMHGLIKFLTSQDAAAVSLRSSFVFKIIPMLNPDGVIHGSYRCSMVGTDLNRRYRDDNPIFHPTVSALKNVLKNAHDDRGVLLYLDLHGHSKKKNAFVYGCDATLLSENFPSPITVLSNEEKMMQKIYTRIFPTILCFLSNKDSGGYFSSADNSFKVQKSKKGTARVVSWKDIGIEGSYTIESSFCSNGDNNERRNIINAFKYESFRTNDDDDNDSSKMLFVNANPESLRLSYQHARHYTRNDYLKMGQQIGLSIFSFANLEPGSTAADSAKTDETNNFDDDIEENAMNSNPYGGFKEQSNAGNLVKISYNTYEKCTRPMLRPAIFSSDAIVKAMNNASVFQKCLRLQCEIYLRKQFGDPDTVIDVRNPSYVNLIDRNFGTLEDEVDEGSIGSDSDPSVDNQKTLVSAKDIKKLKNNNILNFFLKSTIRRLKENYERSVDFDGVNASTVTVNSNNKSIKSTKIPVRQLNRKNISRTSYNFKNINPTNDSGDELGLKSENSDQSVNVSNKERNSRSPAPVFTYEELHWNEKSNKTQVKSNIKPDYAFLVPSTFQGNMRDSLLFPQKSTSSITGITPFGKIVDNSANFSSHSNSIFSPNNSYNSPNDGFIAGNDYGSPKFKRDKVISPPIELFSKEKGGRSSPINIFESYTSKNTNTFSTSSTLKTEVSRSKKETNLSDFFRAMNGPSIPLPSSSTNGLVEDKELISNPKMYSPDSPAPQPSGYTLRKKITK